VFTVSCRYFVPLSDVLTRKPHPSRKWSLAIRAMAGAVANIRTLVAAVLPLCGAGNSLLVFDCPDFLSAESYAALLGILNSFVCDYFIRQKISGVNLNQFALKQLPMLRPEELGQDCTWHRGVSYAHWSVLRVLGLTYTAWDLQPFAQDCGYDGPPFRWDGERRFLLRCELDAAYFHLYGIARDDVDYIMETFPIVKRKDEAAHGEYRTKRVILEIYDAMQRAMETGEPYQTLLDPPPADPRVAHPPRDVTGNQD